LTGWAALILTVASVLAVATSSGVARVELLAAAELGFACTLNAAACTLMLQGTARGALRFSPRVIAALALGLTGLVFAVVSARRGPQTLTIVPILALVAVIASSIGAAVLEFAAIERNRLQEARLARDLLTGTFLSMAAIACASLAVAAGSIAQSHNPMSADTTWNAAILAARLAWLHVFAVTLPLIIVFMRRTELAGLGTLAATGNWPTLVLVCVAGIGWARYQLSASAEDVFSAAQRTAVRAAVTPKPELVGVSLPAAAPVEPSEVAPSAAIEDAGNPAVPDAKDARHKDSVTPQLETASDGAPPSRIRIGGVKVEGMHEADAYGGVERRFNLLDECLKKHGEDSGELTAKVTIDEKGSVTRVVPTEGNMQETKLGQCLMLSFYRMGFAAAKSGTATFVLSLHVSAP
jgi:hypothetical protein